MTVGRGARIGADWPLLAGPLALLAGLALLKLSDMLLTIGPLDRAQFGWSIPVPMLLLAPGLIGLASRRSGETAGRVTAVLTGALFGGIIAVAWFASTSWVGCDPHPALTARILSSLPIPLVLGVGWALAGWCAVAWRDRPIRSVAVGIGVGVTSGVAMILTWAAFFPGLTCVPVATPA